MIETIFTQEDLLFLLILVVSGFIGYAISLIKAKQNNEYFTDQIELICRRLVDGRTSSD